MIARTALGVPDSPVGGSRAAARALEAARAVRLSSSLSVHDVRRGFRDAFCTSPPVNCGGVSVVTKRQKSAAALSIAAISSDVGLERYFPPARPSPMAAYT